MSRADDAAEWLGTRSPAPPAELAERIAEAVSDSPEPERSERFAAAALSRLRAVLASPGERASALDLLTADALITYACEAAAEQGPACLARVVEAMSPERLAGLLEGE